MPSSTCIRMTIRTCHFFNVDSLLFSPFSEPVMLWSLVTITHFWPWLSLRCFIMLRHFGSITARFLGVLAVRFLLLFFYKWDSRSSKCFLTSCFIYVASGFVSDVLVACINCLEYRDVTTGGQGGTQFPGGQITSVEGRKVLTMSQVPSSTADLLLKGLKFEHGGAKFVSCLGRHLTSLGPCLSIMKIRRCLTLFSMRAKPCLVGLSDEINNTVKLSKVEAWNFTKTNF